MRTPKEEILFLLGKALDIAYDINGSADLEQDLEELEAKIKKAVEEACE